MNAVLFYFVNNFRLTGSTINAFEYFISAYEHNKDIKLILIDCSKRNLKKFLRVVENRYELSDISDYKKNIVCLKKYDLMRMNDLDTVLVLDFYTIKMTRGLFKPKKLLVISEYKTDKPDYFFSTHLYNVKYYGEMPFHYKDIDYRMKCLFHRFKRLRKVKKGTYVSSPFNDFIERDARLHGYDCPRPFIFKSKTKHKENLFEQFTNFLYIHCALWFDPHPRLFLECEFYGKRIHYINNNGILDGSVYRYNDVKHNGLKDRFLDRMDPIIGQLI